MSPTQINGDEPCKVTDFQDHSVFAYDSSGVYSIGARQADGLIGCRVGKLSWPMRLTPGQLLQRDHTDKNCPPSYVLLDTDLGTATVSAVSANTGGSREGDCNGSEGCIGHPQIRGNQDGVGYLHFHASSCVSSDNKIHYYKMGQGVGDLTLEASQEGASTFTLKSGDKITTMTQLRPVAGKVYTADVKNDHHLRQLYLIEFSEDEFLFLKGNEVQHSKENSERSSESDDSDSSSSSSGSTVVPIQ